MRTRLFFLSIILSLGQVYSFEKESLFYASGFEQAVFSPNVYRPPKPLMWTAIVKVDRSVIIGYEKNIYQPNRFFSLYCGMSSGFLQTLQKSPDELYVFSGYLLARLYVYHTSMFKAYFLYSPAGPSVLSKKDFATTGFSNRFVFQDQFGIGIAVGKDATMECFAKLYHFSNGELFPINGGIDIPLMLGISIRL